MGLKEQRAKAKATRSKPAAKQPDIKGMLSEASSVTVAALQEVSRQNSELIAVLQKQIDSQARQLADLIGRPVEVSAGNVDVHLPVRASRFRIEYNEYGRPGWLVPEYEVQH